MNWSQYRFNQGFNQKTSSQPQIFKVEEAEEAKEE